MQKVAFIGDPHFGRRAENATIRKHVSEGQKRWFLSLADDLRSRNISQIFITGDIFDTRNSVNVEAMVNTKRLLAETLAEFQIDIVLGNHDMYFENSYDITSIEMLEMIPNVTVHRNGIVKKSMFGYDFYIVPWVISPDLDKFSSFLKEIAPNRSNNVLFGHFEMIGIDMEGGNLSTFGLSPNDFANSAKYIFSGHYHGQSVQSIDGSEIQYFGSPYPLTFANSDSIHGYWTIDSDMKREFIPNTISPTFKTIIDTDDIDSFGDLSNSFIRLYMNNARTKEELFEVRTRLDAKNALLIVPIPYKDGSIETGKNASQRDANVMLNMDAMALSEMYLDINADIIPILKTEKDARKAILDRIREYNSKLGIN